MTTQKEKLLDHFANFHCKIHFSFDLRSTPHKLALLSIVGHWISADGISHQGLHAVRGVDSAHSRENHCDILLNVKKEYTLLGKLGYCTRDNATNNDKA